MRLASPLLWLATAALVAAVGLRFAMRAIGVRDELPFPTLLYSLTAPLVEPFYRYFPAPERFDLRAVEVASLAAAGVVVALALGFYALALLVVAGRRSQVSRSGS
jgi:hypothetical protein